MKKVKWIALALVLCLGLIGGAYAYWQETLVITGTVETAEFDVKFSEPITIDFGEEVRFRQWDYYADGSWSDPLESGKRGGASGTFVKTDDTTLTFTIENGWPYMTVAGFVDVENNSDIPVKLEEIRILDGDSNPVDTWKYGQSGWIYGSAFAVGVSKYERENFDGTQDDAVVDYTEFAVGDIIEAKESLTICVSAFLQSGEFVPTTEENYSFTIEMDWVQWNKPAE